jgi:hypothetical protein
MTPEQFLKRASTPVQWLNKAHALRQSANAVWEESQKRQLCARDAATGKCDPDKAGPAIDIHFNSLLLYSLSAECALKGLIIKNDPSSIRFKTTMDGTGELVDAEITKLGSTSFDTHNLERLAEIVGMLKPGDRPELRELLSFCTHCIQWLGRYPIPLDSASDFIPRGKIPGAVFGHYFRGFMDPFLDDVISQLAAPGHTLARAQAEDASGGA